MFEIDQQLFDKGELDTDKVSDYVDGLMEAFAAGPQEAKPLLDSGKRLSWVPMMLDYAFNHLGVPPAKMTLANFNEILFDLFPQKVSVEAELASEIVEELRAFWQFVHRAYGLRKAGEIAASLTPHATDRLHKLLADPANFGMAKSFFMMGQKAGFDMTTQAGLDQFMLFYNSQLLNKPSPLPRPMGGGLFPFLPPMGMPSKERADRREAKKRQRKAHKRKGK